MATVPEAVPGAVSDQVSKENAYGITEFVCPLLLGFTGTLKKRYTDFNVNEILPSGEVVHLDDERTPEQCKRDGLNHDPRTQIDCKPVSSNQQAQFQKDEDNAPAASIKEPEVVSKSTVIAEAGTGSNSDAQISSPTPGPHPASAIPLSMQGFDTPPKKPEELPPHLRHPTSSTVNHSLKRSYDETTSPAKPAPRKKETVRIRNTVQGWVEVDEEKDKHYQSVQNPASSDVVVEVEEAKPQPSQHDEKKQSNALQETSEPPVVQSTQASWQAFAKKESAGTEASNDFQLTPANLVTLCSYFNQNVINEILALCNRILNSPTRKAKDYGIVTTAVIDRQTRSKVHQDIRRIFNSMLETTTTNGGAIIIAAVPKNPTFHARNSVGNHQDDKRPGNRELGRNWRGRGGHQDNGRSRDNRVNRKDQWLELGGDYLHFSLCKENKDTMEVISFLTNQLGMKPSAFQFAGTKDRRGVTVQRISVYRVFAHRMASVGHMLRNAKIGNYEYRPRPLQLGELTGNEFVITLRDCDFHYPIPVDSKTMVDTAHGLVRLAVTHLANSGFINYYGLQRFGTFTKGTDEIGMKMLQGEFEAAVEDILYFDPATLVAAPDTKALSEDKARASALNSFKTTGKSHPALRDLPKKFSTEWNIIQHLSRPNNSRDFFGAVSSISRNMRLMYLHAYQSLVWNMAASERWRRFKATVVPGDLVLVDEHKDKLGPLKEVKETDADGEVIVRPSEDDRAADPEDRFTRARVLTKEEAESGLYTIFDIVLPTPGYDILYPSNEVGKFYETFMASARGGGLDPHDMRRKQKDCSLSGSYRKLLARPSPEFSFDVKVYKDDNEKFVETDLDRLEKAKWDKLRAQHSHSAPLRDDPAHPAKDEAKPDKPPMASNESKPQNNQTVQSSPMESEPGGVKLSGGPYQDYKIAVILKLQLGSSTYATMALRELMKHGGARMHKYDDGPAR